MSFAPVAPDPWLNLSESERDSRSKLDSDLCVIGNTDFFVRGCLEIPVFNCEEPFLWGAWISVSKQSFEHILEAWNLQIRKDDPPLFGWLCNNISVYPTTLGLKARAYLRNEAKRPLIELESTDHPLAIEQRQGISLQRVEEIAAALLPIH